MAIASKFPNTFPSLNLDFAKTKELDPRVTFTRASTATFVDSTGALRTAQANQPRFTHDPLTGECLGLLIEEQRTNSLTYSDQFDNAAWTKSNSFVQTNLLTYSEQFDNAAWGKADATISANVTTAPNGAATADKLAETATTAEHLTWFPRTASNETATFSVYAKASERTRVRIGFSNFLNDARGAIFDLSTGAIVSISSSGTDYTNLNAIIETVGNGWYRCIFTATKGSANTTNNAFVETVSGTSFNYAGTLGSGLFLWGAQLVQGSSAGEYTQTVASTAPVTYTDPFNAKTAMKLVEDTANDLHRVRQTITLASAVHSFSVYVKAAERSWVYLVNASVLNSFCYFDLTNGTKGTEGASAVGSIEDIGNGWYRCAILTTAVGGGNTYDVRIASEDGTNSYTGDGTSGIYITDAQLEAGAFPTSYIPTTVSTATRSADNANMTGTNFSQWYNQGEGTLFVDLINSTRATSVTYPRLVACVGSNANLNEISIYTRTDPAIIGFGQALGSVIENGVTTFDPGGISLQVNIWKAAIAYKTNDTAYAVSGAVSSTDTSVILPNAVAMSIGGAVRYQPPIGRCVYKSIRYYPERLSNEQLQALTS